MPKEMKLWQLMDPVSQTSPGGSWAGLRTRSVVTGERWRQSWLLCPPAVACPCLEGHQQQQGICHVREQEAHTTPAGQDKDRR